MLLAVLRNGLARAFRGRQIVLTLLVLAASAVMVRLGFWQLDRLEQKRARNARILAVVEAPPIQVNREPPTGDPASYRYRRAVARGRYDPQGQIFLRNRFYQGRPGFRVLTPLVLEGHQNLAIAVDRGWVPQPDADAYPPPTGEVTVEGYLLPGETRADVTPMPGETVWYWANLAQLDARLPYRVLPVYLVATPPEGTGPDLEPPIQEPLRLNLDEGPHLGYALQWFLFSVAVPVVYVYQLGRRALKQTPNRKPE